MKKAIFQGYSGINTPSINTMDAVQNQRLDMLKEVDRKHDQQFTWTLVWSVFTFLWMSILTALLAVGK